MAEQKWFEGLRRQIKHRCGPGWGIDERHGGVRLTRRIAAGKQHKNPRQTVQLGIPWNPAHSGDIFLVVCQIRERMENGEELVGLAVELAEDPSGGVQVRVLMDSNVVSGVTVVPLQQGGCCD